MSTASPTTPTGSPGPDGPATAAVPVLGPAGVGMGVLSIVLGVLVLAWPGATLLVVAVLFGVQLIVLGALRIALGRSVPSEPRWLRPVVVVLGVLTVVAGIICLFRPSTSLFVVAIFLAAGWVVEGLSALVQAVTTDRSVGARIFYFVSGIISVVAGLVVATFPGDSLVLLTRFGGIMLVLIGIAEVVTSILARRAPRPAA